MFFQGVQAPYDMAVGGNGTPVRVRVEVVSVGEGRQATCLGLTSGPHRSIFNTTVHVI